MVLSLCARTRRSSSDQDGPPPRSRSGARRSSAMRQDDTGPAIPSFRLGQLLRPRIASEPRSSGRTDDRSGTPARTGRHRRGAVATGAVSDAARARRPDPRALAVPGSGQRVRAASPTDIREPGGPRGTDLAGRFHAARDDRRVARRAGAIVAPRGDAALVSRRERSGQRCLASGVHTDAVGTGLSAMGHFRARGGDGAFLDHAGALPRTDVERRRTGQGARRSAGRGPPLSGHPHRRDDGAPTATVVRQPAQAPGEGTEDLPAGLGSAAPIARHSHREGTHDASPASARHGKGLFSSRCSPWNPTTKPTFGRRIKVPKSI